MADKIPVSGAMRVNVYTVLLDCVERGVDFGWNHAHKHTDKPEEHDIRRHIVDDIMDEICEYFDFALPEE
jgi:hypothetical protein